MLKPISVRVQGQGRLTLPGAVRERLGLKTGSFVTFVETPEGVVIKPAAVVANEALDEIGHALKAKGIKLQNLLKRGREIRSELAAERYGLPVTKPEQAEQVREK
jgi:AbrB family looped-hinge helix DNA binding protein